MKFPPPPEPEEWKKGSEAEYYRAFRAVKDAYERYLDGLGDALPARVRELTRLPDTDDGLIANVQHDCKKRLLQLTLRCCGCVAGCYDLVLIYLDATITPDDEKLLARLARSTVDNHDFDADLYRHEIDLTEDAHIEHRLEFHIYRAPDIWFAIRCRALEWKTIPRPNRGLPNTPNPKKPERFQGGPPTRRGRLRQQEREELANRTRTGV